MIGNNKIGKEYPALVVAEIAQAHDGSLGMAHAYIDAVAKTGADIIKFQTHIADAESTLDEPFRVKFSLQDITRYDYWKRMEFTKEQWVGLAQHAHDKGLIFLSSPFSVEAFELLDEIGMPAWKVSSGEIYNPLLFNRILKAKRPVLLSTGMSNLSEIDDAVNLLEINKVPFLLFQCTTNYPCPPEKVGLNLIDYLKDKYQCPVGLSDHSGTIYPGLSAAAKGISMIEIHITLSREMFGPDVSSSITTNELKQLVEGVRFIEKMISNPVDKDIVASEKIDLRSIFAKSIIVKSNLTADTIIKEEHLTLKKPGTGIPASEIYNIIGKKLKCDIQANEMLTYDHLK